MSESLSTRVARFMHQRPARRSGKARAAVIAMREQIQEALNDGWSVKAVWQTLHAEGAVEVGYHAFRRHVAQLARSHGRPQRPVAGAGAALAPTEKPRTFRHSRVPEKDKIYG